MEAEMATQQSTGDKSAKGRNQTPPRNPNMPGRGSTSAGRGQAVAKGSVRGGQDATRERDELYGVVSVLYHALQGAETYAQYVDDARRAGDDQLVKFFEQCQEEEIARAQRAKEMLARRLGGAVGEEEGEDEDDDEDDEDEDEDDDEDDEDDE
jgi:hypothetical protein